MLTEFGIGAAFAFGFLGSLSHCLAMCGGFSVLMGRSRHPHQALGLYHGGRVATYMLLGVAGGFAGSLVNLSVPALHSMQTGAVWLSAGVMILGGLSLLFGRDPAIGGGRIGKAVQHLASHVLRGKRSASPLLLGLVLGFLPCGLIYSALSFAVLTANPLHGALAMGAFGLGTVPVLFATGTLATRLKTIHPLVGRTAGGWLTACGIYFLVAGFPG
jgi:uncharacterized protein